MLLVLFNDRLLLAGGKNIKLQHTEWDNRLLLVWSSPQWTLSLLGEKKTERCKWQYQVTMGKPLGGGRCRHNSYRQLVENKTEEKKRKVASLSRCFPLARISRAEGGGWKIRFPSAFHCLLGSFSGEWAFAWRVLFPSDHLNMLQPATPLKASRNVGFSNRPLGGGSVMSRSGQTSVDDDCGRDELCQVLCPLFTFICLFKLCLEIFLGKAADDFPSPPFDCYWLWPDWHTHTHTQRGRKLFTAEEQVVGVVQGTMKNRKEGLLGSSVLRLIWVELREKMGVKPVWSWHKITFCGMIGVIPARKTRFICLFASDFEA